MADPKLVEHYAQQLRKQGVYPEMQIPEKAEKLAAAHERREKRKAKTPTP